MPNQLTISSINVVFSEDEDVTTAKDRPVRPGELEDLGVSKEFLKNINENQSFLNRST